MATKEELIERISAGHAELLDISDICKRLKISRSTFERMYKPPCTRRGVKSTLVPVKFPAPDIMFGRSPRWDIQTLKQWLGDCAPKAPPTPFEIKYVTNAGIVIQGNGFDEIEICDPAQARPFFDWLNTHLPPRSAP